MLPAARERQPRDDVEALRGGGERGAAVDFARQLVVRRVREQHQRVDVPSTEQGVVDALGGVTTGQHGYGFVGHAGQIDDREIKHRADPADVRRRDHFGAGERRPCGFDADTMHTSSRTLYRRFLKETGITFARWKQQARLLESIRRLAEGTPVTTVALDLGYDSPSAFSTMFRRSLGIAPRGFVAEMGI